MNKIAGADVRRLLNAFLSEPDSRSACLPVLVTTVHVFDFIVFIRNGHKKYGEVSVLRLCRSDQFLGFVRGQTALAIPSCMPLAICMHLRWTRYCGTIRLMGTTFRSRVHAIRKRHAAFSRSAEGVRKR